MDFFEDELENPFGIDDEDYYDFFEDGLENPFEVNGEDYYDLFNPTSPSILKSTTTTTTKESILYMKPVSTNEFNQQKTDFTEFYNNYEEEEEEEIRPMPLPEPEKPTFKFRQSRSKKFIDIINMGQIDLLKEPYAYTLIIKGIDHTKAIDIKLLFEDTGKVVSENAIEMSKVLRIGNEMRVSIKFMVTSFKNKRRQFKFVAFSGGKEILKSGCFYLVARPKKICPSLDVSKPGKSKKLEKVENAISQYSGQDVCEIKVKKTENKMKKTRIRRLCMYDKTNHTFCGYLNIPDDSILKCKRFFDSIGLNSVLFY